MQTIDIRKQPRMRFSRALIMTLHGIRYRLFRAGVTVMVIAVAVAFLMNVACESVVTASVSEVTHASVREARTLARWVSRMTTVPSVEDVLRTLVGAEADSEAERETLVMSGITPEELQPLRESAREAVLYLDFFEWLGYAEARRLVHRSRGPAVFEWLQPEARRAEFRDTIEQMRSVRFVGDHEAFLAFLDGWPVLRHQVERIRAGRERAVTTIAEALQGATLMHALADAEGAFGEVIRRAGFMLPPERAGDIARRATDALDLRLLSEAIAVPAIRGAVAAYLDVLPGAVDEVALWRLLEDRRRADWFQARLAEAHHPAARLSADRLRALALLELGNRRLLLVEQQAMPEGGGGIAGLGERMSWLLLVSVFVCMVGIANAMLMAVTERFREIATLKCLGALDGTIMIMFVLEAALMGVVGGLMGSVLGVAIGMGRMAVQFRGLLGGAIPWAGLAAAMGASLLLGIVLAAVASVYPSLKAARLAPMEAMRIE